MNRNKTYLSWGMVFACIFTSMMINVVAAGASSIKWPSTMLVQEGTSSSILSSGMVQPLETGLRDIGIDTNTSYQILDKRGNNCYYGRYGEGTLLYGFGPQKDGWHPTTVPEGGRYTLSMIRDYEAYVQEHPETFTLVTPFRETRKNIYVGEIIVNTWFKQVEYPMYVQIAFLADNTGTPRLRYIMTHVQDVALRKQLQYLL